MSLKAMLWALYEAPTDDPVETLVLVALAENASDEGTWAWPSRAIIARKARISLSTVSRHLSSLIAQGLIREQPGAVAPVARADRRPKVYELALGRRFAEDPPLSTEERGVNLTPREREDDEHGVSPLTTRDGERGVNDDAHGVSLVTHKPSLEPKEPQTPSPDEPDEPDDDQPRSRRGRCALHGDDTRDNCRGCGTNHRRKRTEAEIEEDRARSRDLLNDLGRAASRAARPEVVAEHIARLRAELSRVETDAEEAGPDEAIATAAQDPPAVRPQDAQPEPARQRVPDPDATSLGSPWTETYSQLQARKDAEAAARTAAGAAGTAPAAPKPPSAVPDAQGGSETAPEAPPAASGDPAGGAPADRQAVDGPVRAGPPPQGHRDPPPGDPG